MDTEKTQKIARSAWELARRQHHVVTRRQLLALGMRPEAIGHRLASGRLHRVHAGIYAVGRRQLPRHGELLAAVLACGEGALLTHRSAAELWGLGSRARYEVAVPAGRTPKRPGVRVYRHDIDPAHATVRHGIAVTTPARTLVDIASHLEADALERAVNEADRLDLIDPERLRESLAALKGAHGVAKLRILLDWRTFTLSDSKLERRFKPIARTAGLPPPLTQQMVNGWQVDFFWPDLGLVVETDGLRYHRTAEQQTRALRRDQAHWAAGLLPLRFSHAQVAYDGAHVERTLRRAATRLGVGKPPRVRAPRFAPR